MRPKSKNEIINQYSRQHRRVRLRSISSRPRWFVKWQGKNDAKKNLIQNDQTNLWVMEKNEILKQKIRAEIAYTEKILYDCREESGSCVQEFFYNEQLLNELETQIDSVETTSLSDNALQKRELKSAKITELKERNKNILMRLWNIEETINSIEELSKQWIDKNKNSLREKTAVYFLGAKEVIPDIEPVFIENEILDYAINHEKNSNQRNLLLGRKGVDSDVENEA